MNRAYSSAEALEMLGALSQENRLDIFRLLVRSGSDGLAAGAIARHCELPPPTCSFHLKELRKGGLLSCHRRGRSQIYTVNPQGVRDLLDYLTEHCCADPDHDHETPNGVNRTSGSGVNGRVSGR